MPSIQDCVQSAKNIELLRSYAKQKLLPEFSDKTAALEAAIEASLETIITGALENVASWSPTPENIAEVNVTIWQALRPRVVALMRGAEQTQAEKAALLRNRFTVPEHHGEDEIADTREESFYAERHAKAWQ